GQRFLADCKNVQSGRSPNRICTFLPLTRAIISALVGLLDLTERNNDCRPYCDPTIFPTFLRVTSTLLRTPFSPAASNSAKGDRSRIVDRHPMAMCAINQIVVGLIRRTVCLSRLIDEFGASRPMAKILTESVEPGPPYWRSATAPH